MTALTDEEINAVQINELDEDEMLTANNQIQKITNEKNIDNETARQAVKALHHPKTRNKNIIKLEGISLYDAYELITAGYNTIDAIANADDTELQQVTGISAAQAKCIHEIARNEQNHFPTMVSDVSDVTGRDRDTIYSDYKELVQYDHTGFDSVTPGNAQEFLIQYYRTTDPTSVYTFDMFELDMIKLLIDNGYETAAHIASTDISDIREIQYNNIFGIADNNVSESKAKTIKNVARYRLKQGDEDLTPHGEETLPKITAIIDEIKHDDTSKQMFTKKSRFIHVGSLIGLAAYELQLPKDVVFETASIFSKAQRAGVAKGSSIETIIAGSLRVAILKQDYARPWETIATVFDVDKRHAMKQFHNIIAQTDLQETMAPTDIMMNPSDCAEYIIMELSLELSPETVTEIQDVIADTEVNGNSPWPVVAAIMYNVISETDHTITQDMLADIAEISTVSIRNHT